MAESKSVTPLDLDAIRARLEAAVSDLADIPVLDADGLVRCASSSVYVETLTQLNTDMHALVAEVERYRAFEARVEAWRNKSLEQLDQADVPGRWYDEKMWKEVFND